MESLGSSPANSGEFPTGTTTAVAIDRDKNSQQAVKWAVDNLLTSAPVVTLIHVRPKVGAVAAFGYGIPTGFSIGGQSPQPSQEQSEADLQQLFVPYRGFCARKGLYLKEVILEDVEVSKAIIDYISANNIQNIIVGYSNRNALMRKLRNPDVPSCLIKSVPDHCAVYVIYKGKPITVRAAKGAAPNTAMPPRAVAQGNLPDPDDSVRSARSYRGGQYPASPNPADRRPFERFYDNNKTSSRDRPGSRSSPNNYFSDDQDSSVRHARYSDHRESRDSFSEDGEIMGRQSMDFPDSVEFRSSFETSGDATPTSGSHRDAEAEMRKLRLELKQTMDMYSTACKEALTAKQKTKELHQWKLDEAIKFEELKRTEETAIAMAEMEKNKCQAALEAADAAQRIAELELQKRMYAERKAKHESEQKNKALDALANTDSRYRKYTIDEIEVATNNFAGSLKIGEGGYGPVYKAHLDHTPVAIKVLKADAAQGRKQFQQEIEVLSSIRHPNMVLLLGACPEYGCLVYEHMDFGSLEDRLFRRGNTQPIPWSIRFKIAAEIATGLLFLHQAKPEPLVHRDLKPGNILLDRNYTSKISDVGLARLVPPSVADTVTQYRMTSTAGTFCYIDPEYQQTGMLGTKSDIYSLGIMLLQIITAKPPMGLTHHVEKAIERGKFHEMLDQSVTDWPVEEALIFAELALKCSELRKKDRPDLKTVILPALNQLRNLGKTYDATSNYNGSGNSSTSGTSFGPYYSSNSSGTSCGNFSNALQRPRPLAHKEKISSNPSLQAPWMSKGYNIG